MTHVERSKSVLITGCSPGGIGNALAREFWAKGFYVVASARSRDAIVDLEELGMETVSLDVESILSIEKAKAEVERLLSGRGGRLDILVNNAGKNLTLPALDVPLDEARSCFETNFFGIVAIVQAFAPLLISAQGLIINIGSVAAIVPYVYGSIYNASKAALHAWSQTLRLELEPYGVRVMVVVTGGIQSRIARTKRVLPEGSLYLEVNDEFQRRVSHSQENAMPNQVYARGVVAEAMRKNPRKWVWRGNMAFVIKFVRDWLGSWIFDLVLPRMFGLSRLKALLKAKSKRS